MSVSATAFRKFASHARLARVLERLPEEDGQAVVEFALVAVVFLILLFGITQFGFALNSANDETHIASEVARYAAVNFNPTSGGQSLQQWGAAQGDNTFLSSSGKVCISFPNGTSNVGDPIKVVATMTMDWQPVYGLSQMLGGGIPATTTVQGTAVMRLEGTPSNYSAGCSS